MEERLVCPVDRVGAVDLMQINAHGLDLSNNPVLIRSLRPRVVIVNNGPDKGAELQTMQTLMTLPAIEDIWQVHRNLKTGATGNTEQERIANRDADCKAEYIKAVVEPRQVHAANRSSGHTSELCRALNSERDAPFANWVSRWDRNCLLPHLPRQD